MKNGYVIGVDFGSDSVRAVIIDVDTGKICGNAQTGYPRWLAGKYQNSDKNLFRQHPLDYLESFSWCINVALKQAGDDVRSKILAISIDTTGSTPCPVNKDGTPLALLSEFKENVNAMFHLWKDHTAVKEAYEVNRMLKEAGNTNYTKYQGTYSSEWYWAKILHTTRIDKEVREAAYSWVEHCDWMLGLLCGNTNPDTLERTACAAGHKALWHSEWGGLPEKECFVQLHERLGDIHDTFKKAPVPAGQKIGTMTPEWAKELGVPKGTIVGSGSFDAHAGAVGAGIKKHVMVTNIGTSTVNMLIEEAVNLQGKDLGAICGLAEDSIIPGYMGVETSQAAFGDVYAWFNNLLLWPIKNVISQTETITKGERGRLIRQTSERMLGELARQAEALEITDSLISLDWFNGRRYPNINENIKSAIWGFSLGTDAPAIYQSLVMATIFGQKKIVDSLLQKEFVIDEMIAVGGIAQKSPYVMQMMADVLEFPVNVSASSQACARGAAIYAAVAGGVYDSIEQAQKKLCDGFIQTYIPNGSKKKIYQNAYKKYCELGEFVEAH